jgi:multidrug resistance protein, MATE family
VISAAPITRGEVMRRAWPIIVANATLPLLGLVDTAVIGNTGSVLDLGAIALGALVFNFLLFGLGFLRMGTTGFVAQAAGAGDEPEVRAVLGRALLLAAAIGIALWSLKPLVPAFALELLHGSAAVERVAGEYIDVRLWGVPASLATLTVRGALIGLGYSRELLVLELVLNGVNLALDLIFAGALGWGARGVALGSSLAEWIGLLLSLAIIRRRLRERRRDAEPFFAWARVWQLSRMKQLLHANADIMLRTLLLLAGFAIFTDRGARFGDATLAANHVLLQFLSFSAFFLDGYANVAESLVGAAIGARRRDRFDLAVRRSSELALMSALVLAVAWWVLGPLAIDLLTDLAAVRSAARAFLPYAALYVLLSVAAFQLDGIFIGATRTRDMRNAALLSLAAFLLALGLLAGRAGNHGLWLAFNAFVVARALALGLHYPGLRRSI